MSKFDRRQTAAIRAAAAALRAQKVHVTNKITDGNGNYCALGHIFMQMYGTTIGPDGGFHLQLIVASLALGQKGIARVNDENDKSFVVDHLEKIVERFGS